jgi:hypothetical protein
MRSRTGGPGDAAPAAGERLRNATDVERRTDAGRDVEQYQPSVSYSQRGFSAMEHEPQPSVGFGHLRQVNQQAVRPAFDQAAETGAELADGDSVQCARNDYGGVVVTALN